MFLRKLMFLDHMYYSTMLWVYLLEILPHLDLSKVVILA